MAEHLAIFSQHLGDKVINGIKTVDFRFSKNAVVPYEKLLKGDTVYIKNSGEKIIGQIEVENVLFFDNLNDEKVSTIINNYLKDAALSISDLDLFSKNARFLTIIFFKNPQRYIANLNIPKKDRRGWSIIS